MLYEKNNKALPVAIFGFILMICVTGYVGYSTYSMFANSVRPLASVGWAKEVGAKTASDFTWRCMMESKCFDRWQKVALSKSPVSLDVLIIGAAVPIFVFLIGIGMMRRPRARKAPGQGGWATQKDLEPFFTNNAPVGYMGIWENKKPVRLSEADRNSHTFTLGGTGAGKTTSFLQPNVLLNALGKHSTVIFDLKFPDRHSGLLWAIDYYQHFKLPVIRFTPFRDDSTRVPIFEHVKDYTDAQDVAYAFEPVPVTARSDQFYIDLRRNVLSAIILGVTQDGNPSFYRVLEIVASGANGIARYCKDRPQLLQYIKNFVELKGDVQSGILAGLASKLDIFRDKNLSRAFSGSSKDTNVLDMGVVCVTPALLYIGLDQDKIQGGAGIPILQLLKRILDKEILRIAAENDGQLPVHTSIVFDEFPSLGTIPNIHENLATMRSKRVAYFIAMQNLAQGHNLYGKSGFDALITSNFGQIIIFPNSLRLEDAEFFERMLGSITVIEESQGESSGGLYNTKNRTYREVKRPLLSKEEMHRFAKAKAVIQLQGTGWATVDTPGLYSTQHPLHKLHLKATSNLTGKTPEVRESLRLGSKPINETPPTQSNPTEEPISTTAQEIVQVAAQNSPFVKPVSEIQMPKSKPDSAKPKPRITALHLPQQVLEPTHSFLTETNPANPQTDHIPSPDTTVLQPETAEMEAAQTTIPVISAVPEEIKADYLNWLEAQLMQLPALERLAIGTNFIGIKFLKHPIIAPQLLATLQKHDYVKAVEDTIMLTADGLKQSGQLLTAYVRMANLSQATGFYKANQHLFVPEPELMTLEKAGFLQYPDLYVLPRFWNQLGAKQDPIKVSIQTPTRSITVYALNLTGNHKTGSLASKVAIKKKTVNKPKPPINPTQPLSAAISES
jgi:type IV secretion system protein VirD4